MELHLLLHSVVTHVTAALLILVYIPLSVPVMLFLRAFVKPLSKEDLRGKVVLITGASSGIGEASKAAQLRFYETLRTEVGSEVGITILTPGYVESEITKGKGIQKTGEVAVDEDARHAQIGVLPVARVEALCEVALDGIRNGDWYVTWPSMYRPLQLIACLAPEVLHWMSYAMYREATTAEGRRPLGQRILEVTGGKRLFPPSLLQPRIKTD